VPHPARRYNYWLGGTDNFAVDRESGDEFGELMRALPAGSFLALAHGTHDFAPDQVATHQRMVDRGRSDFWTRDKAEITALFDGLEIVEPGVVPCSEWRPDGDTPELDRRVVWTYAGVGRKQ
jgi:hypothetical protein